MINKNKIILVLIIILIFANFYLVLNIVENISWRVSGPYQIDNEVGFWGKPYAVADFIDENGNHEVATFNSKGFRGKEFDEKKRKIVLVGSSIVFGHGIKNEETLAQNLEGLLASGSPPVEVVNAGVKAFGIDQVFKLIKTKVIRLHPSHIIWLTNQSHFEDVVSLNLFDLNQAQDQLIERDLKESFFFKSKSFFEKSIFTSFPLLSKLAYNTLNSLNIFFDTKVKMGKKKYLQKFSLMTRELSKIAMANRIKISIVVMPDRYNKSYPQNILKYSQLPIYDFSRNKKYEINEKKYYLNNDYHFTQLGNFEMANLVYNHILK